MFEKKFWFQNLVDVVWETDCWVVWNCLRKWFLEPESGNRTKQDPYFSSGKCFFFFFFFFFFFYIFFFIFFFAISFVKNWFVIICEQVLAATQTPGEAGKKWFQGTADAVRQFIWVFEVKTYDMMLCIF